MVLHELSVMAARPRRASKILTEFFMLMIGICLDWRWVSQLVLDAEFRNFDPFSQVLFFSEARMEK